MINSKILTSNGVNHGFYGQELTKDFGLNVFDLDDTAFDFINRINVSACKCMDQVHGNKIGSERSFKKCDGLVTRAKGIALCVRTADCVPLLIYDKNTNTIGAIHVGIRGAFRGIVQNTIKYLQNIGCKSCIAVLGPSIAKESCKVGNEFKKFFSDEYLDSENRLDLKKFIKNELKNFATEIEDVEIDTFKDENFHSYRREKGTMLRNVSFISL